MAVQFFQATSSLGQSPAAFIADVNTSLAALGSITLLDWTVYSPKPGIIRVTLSYQTGGGGTASILVGYDPSDPDDPEGSLDQLNTALGAAPTVVGTKIRSVRLNRPGQIPIRALFVLAQAENQDANIFSRSLKVVRHTGAGIASGATGDVDILNIDNTVNATITVRNRGGIAWNTGSEGYAFFDEVSGEWVGYPHCL